MDGGALYVTEALGSSFIEDATFRPRYVTPATPRPLNYAGDFPIKTWSARTVTCPCRASSSKIKRCQYRMRPASADAGRVRGGQQLGTGALRPPGEFVFMCPTWRFRGSICLNFLSTCRVSESFAEWLEVLVWGEGAKWMLHLLNASVLQGGRKGVVRIWRVLHEVGCRTRKWTCDTLDDEYRICFARFWINVTTTFLALNFWLCSLTLRDGFLYRVRQITFSFLKCYKKTTEYFLKFLFLFESTILPVNNGK